ncbi:MAG: choloylglycine hydrolase [Lachnospiraceae bacterium]|nr:choloylglycine hydrolase [Lachnospiraceae bacterium]
MCTAATYVTKDHYFGRNLDLEYSYHEQVAVMPRKYPIAYRNGVKAEEHLAIIGMAFVIEGYPLFYDGINEKGLGMAGLNFPDNCDFRDPVDGKTNIASFELIPWILSQCETVPEAKKLLAEVNITNTAFSPQLPPNPLHWMISDKECQIVVEQTKTGLHVYDDPVGVMTNNPTFDIQMTRLADYRNLTVDQGDCRFAPGLDLHAYSRGMGGMGLPGDLSSASRFVKVAFTRMNSKSDDTESASVSQFFKILGSVEQQRGLCCLGPDKYEITIYSSCCNQDKGIYYYTTYENSQINAVDMHKENLDGDTVVTYDLIKGQQIHFQN